MGNDTREEIMRMVEEEDVEFIRLQFTDMLGIMKNIAVTSRELPRALDNGCMIDCADIAGVGDGEETDMYLYPDLDTFTILPWRPQQGKVARLLCDIYHADRTPCESSCRQILKRVCEKAGEEGYTFYVDPECEFFLFHTDDNGVPTTTTHEKAGFLDLSPVDLGENARRDMVLTLEDMGFEILSSHHETSPAQHEIDFRYGEAREMADRLMTFKVAVRTIAKRHGLHATFMPKPRTDLNGSGMHIHFSIFKNGKNILTDAQDPNGLSQEGYSFMGGLLAHSREMAAITNPLVNSYKRLVPGYEAPTQVNWSRKNPASIIRIPYYGDEDTRIELRSPDASANPYLVFACCIAAGMDGIHRNLFPVSACEKNARNALELHQDGGRIQKMPANLAEALQEMEKSLFMKELLGEEFFRQYLNAKKTEWENYTRQVTDWELEEYLLRI